MAADRLALSTVPPEPPADADYDAICAAVTATARGRWFLEEYAKRNRHSDTTQVLAAIARMEATVVSERTQQASREAHQEVHIELLEMARAIAQARAEVAESTPSPSQPPGAEPASAAAPAPDVAAAAERLRQIAWTMRACGVEVVASDQIGQIAETILSADALRGLNEQRAQKLTEALHYLEHRIDRMLDSHRAASERAAEAVPAADISSPPDHDRARDTGQAMHAVAMIAAALRPETAEAEAEPAIPSAATEAAATAMAQDALAASDTADYPMDDDVVLTVADIVPEPEPDPEPEPPTVVVAPASQEDNRVALEIEPLMPASPPAAEDDAETGFTGLDLEPLTVAPMIVVEPATESHAAVVEDIADEPAVADEADEAEVPPAEALPTTAPVAAVTESDTQDSDANDYLAHMFAAEPAAAATPEIDPVAMQVDNDLDGLTDAMPPKAPPQAPPPVFVHAVPAQAVRAQPLVEDDPAEFLPDPTPGKATPQNAPVDALVASSQAARAQLTDTLAAIESELFGSTRPDAGTEAQVPTVVPPPAPKTTVAAAPEGQLTALMALRDEERIALFS